MSFPLISTNASGGSSAAYRAGNQGCDTVGSHVLPLTDLGLPSSYASAQSLDGLAFCTGQPATVFVMATQASGQSTLKLKVGSSSSIDMTSGTTDQAVPVGTPTYHKINTTSANLYVRLRVTDANWSSAFSEFAVYALYELQAGENTNSIRHGHRAVASKQAPYDGSGVIVISTANQ